MSLIDQMRSSRRPPILPSMTWLAERASPRSLFRTHWDHEPGRIGRSRDSVLDCGSPLPLSVGTGTCQSARGLTQSKTWRTLGRFMESLHDFRNAHGADEPLDTKLCCRCDKVLHAVNHRSMKRREASAWVQLIFSERRHSWTPSCASSHCLTSRG